MEDILWITGRNLAETDKGIVWEIVGAFENEEEAVEACYDNKCFVGPVMKNVPFSKETTIWPESYYPFAK